jgi:hypothetical protein
VPVHNQFLLVNGGLNAQALAARGPILQVEIHLPTPLAQHYQNVGTPLPQPTVGLAMVDTGASKTCVDGNVIASMAVPPLNQIQIHTPAGLTSQYLYPARLVFPGTPLPSIDFSSVVGSQLSAQGIVALIGRDVLQHFLLVYNGPAGMFSLSV